MILQADIIISVAEVPLIGICLKAAIAGIKTMLDYGMMENWDATIRDFALERIKDDDPKLENRYEVVRKVLAS